MRNLSKKPMFVLLLLGMTLSVPNAGIASVDILRVNILSKRDELAGLSEARVYSLLRSEISSFRDERGQDLTAEEVFDLIEAFRPVNVLNRMVVFYGYDNNYYGRFTEEEKEKYLDTIIRLLDDADDMLSASSSIILQKEIERVVRGEMRKRNLGRKHIREKTGNRELLDVKTRNQVEKYIGKAEKRIIGAGDAGGEKQLARLSALEAYRYYEHIGIVKENQFRNSLRLAIENEKNTEQFRLQAVLQLSGKGDMSADEKKAVQEFREKSQGESTKVHIEQLMRIHLTE